MISPAGAASARNSLASTPPSGLSPEWTKAWPEVIRAARMEGPVPGPTDQAAWLTRQAADERAVLAATAGAAEALGVKVDGQSLGGTPVLRLSPAGARPGGAVIVYVHGGGFTSLSARSTLFISALMAARTGLEVVSVDYGLAPKQRWPATLDQMVAVYRALLTQGRSSATIGFFGDSAGGAIAASAVLRSRDQGLPLPAAIVLWSPWSDITCSGDSCQTLAAADPLLDVPMLKASAAAYADVADQANPYVSPLYGDYSRGFPPTLIQGGTREIFVSDMVRQYQAIRAGGGEAVLDLYDGLPHVFQPLVPEAPESLVAMERVAAFWASYLKPRP